MNKLFQYTRYKQITIKSISIYQSYEKQKANS